MQKKLILLLSLASLFTGSSAQSPLTPENKAARQQFQNDKFGMFIHWGVYSTLGAGEWVMNERKITKANYARLLKGFYPVNFNADKWVAAAKSAGMKYIVFTTRHHDGFSNWDTKYSDWKITNTPYGKDVLKQLAEACRRQGVKLGLYYSLLDWYREDYPYETGRTGKSSGRTAKSNYAAYLQFMKNQLTELLTNYGPVYSIWLDGHWDQTNAEGSNDLQSRVDWKYNELYALIHRLQPACLIGNNHHQQPFPGEDFQMFERDLPGQNMSGLSYQQASENLPLETCETMNGSWGYNITDTHYKSVKNLIHYLVNAAARNANLLLNIGPMGDGSIQPEFTDTLKVLGQWMQRYGETVYGTRGNVLPPQTWGVVTSKGNTLLVHVLKQPDTGEIFLPGIRAKVISARQYDGKAGLRFRQQPNGVVLNTGPLSPDAVDTILELTLSK